MADAWWEARKSAEVAMRNRLRRLRFYLAHAAPWWYLFSWLDPMPPFFPPELVGFSDAHRAWVECFDAIEALELPAEERERMRELLAEAIRRTCAELAEDVDRNEAQHAAWRERAEAHGWSFT